jgi:hypothetical protein
MNKNISISYKALITLLIFIIITVSLLVEIPVLISYLKNDGDNRLNAIIGTAGNITGGLIGGIVAYIVAAYQVSKSQEQNELVSLKQTYVNLKLLLDEVEFNEKVFKAIPNEEDIQNKVVHLQKQLINDQWNKISPSFAYYLSNEDFKDICKLYRNISFIKMNTHSINDAFINQTYSLTLKIQNNLNSKLEEMTFQIQ